MSICLAGISQLRGNCKWEEERRDAPSFERFLVEIIEFSLRNFLPRNIHRIIRNRFRKWRKRKWKKREFCSRFWDQIFLIFFSFLDEREWNGGFLLFRHVLVVSQRFEDQLCADPTKLFDSYGWPTTCPSLASSWIIQWPLGKVQFSKFNSKNLGGKSGRRGSLSLGQYNNEK